MPNGRKDDSSSISFAQKPSRPGWRKAAKAWGRSPRGQQRFRRPDPNRAARVAAVTPLRRSNRKDKPRPRSPVQLAHDAAGVNGLTAAGRGERCESEKLDLRRMFCPDRGSAWGARCSGSRPCRLALTLPRVRPCPPKRTTSGVPKPAGARGQARRTRAARGFCGRALPGADAGDRDITATR